MDADHLVDCIMVAISRGGVVVKRRVLKRVDGPTFNKELVSFKHEFPETFVTWFNENELRTMLKELDNNPLYF